MGRLNLEFGGGHYDAVLDFARGKVELYTGEDVGAGEHFHSRHGGRQYYTSRSGLSGAGYAPARPTLKPVGSYRIDVSIPWIRLEWEGRGPDCRPRVMGNLIWVPFDYQGSELAVDWPVVIRDERHQLICCTVGEVVPYLCGRVGTAEE